MSRLRFLGTGDALGVPRVYCDCPVCAGARTTGANRRSRCSALWWAAPEQPVLLDCGPDIRTQMEQAGLRQVQTILLTHAHFDHIGGLPEVADVARWTGQPVRVIGPESTLATVSSQYPWVERSLDLVPFEPGLTLGGWQARLWPVNHGKNGISHAYRFDRNGTAWAYCPDSIDLTPEQAQPLHGLDLLVLGAAYWEEQAPRAGRSLYDIQEALALLAKVRPGRTYFTHMSHGVDYQAAYPLPPGIELARDRMEVAIE